MVEILHFLEKAAEAISLFAVAVIIVGLAAATGRYASRFRSSERKDNFKLFQVEFGRVLLLGLEILILADVIETITAPLTFDALAVLATIIVVRTAVSWNLVLSVEGRWPWQPEKEA
jgi:uncharacterized membrane protein